jgi:hypothetical protein
MQLLEIIKRQPMAALFCLLDKVAGCKQVILSKDIWNREECERSANERKVFLRVD